MVLFLAYQDILGLVVCDTNMQHRISLESRPCQDIPGSLPGKGENRPSVGLLAPVPPPVHVRKVKLGQNLAGQGKDVGSVCKSVDWEDGKSGYWSPKWQYGRLPESETAGLHGTLPG